MSRGTTNSTSLSSSTSARDPGVARNPSPAGRVELTSTPSGRVATTRTVAPRNEARATTAAPVADGRRRTLSGRTSDVDGRANWQFRSAVRGADSQDRSHAAPPCPSPPPRRAAGYRADELGHEVGSRPRVHLGRSCQLLELPVAHHPDPVGHREGFFLVVGHEERRDARARAGCGGFSSRNWPRTLASSAESGSSSSSRSGSAHSALANATRCCWPPDSSWAKRWPHARRARPGRAAPRPGRGAWPPGPYAPRARRRRCPARSCSGRGCRPGRPSRAGAGAAAGASRPNRRRARHRCPTARARLPPCSAVVLPQPDGPSSATNSPGATEIERPSRALHLVEAPAGVDDLEAQAFGLPVGVLGRRERRGHHASSRHAAESAGCSAAALDMSWSVLSNSIGVGDALFAFRPDQLKSATSRPHVTIKANTDSATA